MFRNDNNKENKNPSNQPILSGSIAKKPNLAKIHCHFESADGFLTPLMSPLSDATKSSKQKISLRCASESTDNHNHDDGDGQFVAKDTLTFAPDCVCCALNCEFLTCCCGCCCGSLFYCPFMMILYLLWLIQLPLTFIIHLFGSLFLIQPQSIDITLHTAEALHDLYVKQLNHALSSKDMIDAAKLQWNTFLQLRRYWKKYPLLATAIHNTDPHILRLQDVAPSTWWPKRKNPKNRGFHVSAYDILHEYNKLFFEYSCCVRTMNKCQSLRNYLFGSFIPLAKNDDQRFATRSLYVLQENKVWIVCLCLSDEIGSQQMEQIMTWMDKADAVIICGDFNAKPRSNVYQIMAQNGYKTVLNDPMISSETSLHGAATVKIAIDPVMAQYILPHPSLIQIRQRMEANALKFDDIDNVLYRRDCWLIEGSDAIALANHRHLFELVIWRVSTIPAFADCANKQELYQTLFNNKTETLPQFLYNEGIWTVMCSEEFVQMFGEKVLDQIDQIKDETHSYLDETLVRKLKVIAPWKSHDIIIVGQKTCVRDLLRIIRQHEVEHSSMASMFRVLMNKSDAFEWETKSDNVSDTNSVIVSYSCVISKIPSRCRQQQLHQILSAYARWIYADVMELGTAKIEFDDETCLKRFMLDVERGNLHLGGNRLAIKKQEKEIIPRKYRRFSAEYLYH